MLCSGVAQVCHYFFCAPADTFSATIALNPLTIPFSRHLITTLHDAAKNLLKSVRILQKTILDAHTLFFKTSSSQQAGPEGVRSRAVQEWTTLLKPTGLLAVQQLVFLDELLSRFKQSLPTGASTEAEALGFDKAGFDAKELRATGQAELKRLFDKWLSDAVRRVSDRSRRVLGGMASAAQVARLQQLVYECSTTVSAGSAYTAEDWHAASLDLLASPRLRARLEKEKEKDIADVSGDSKAARSTTAADDPPKLLWSTSLRAPFMMQVERLLRASCQAVVTRTREQLISALEAEGISVDTFSLQVSVSSSSHQPTLNAASSLRLFRRAEAIRSQLEGDILQLVGDVVRHPAGSAGSGASGGGSDPQSSAALSRAFYVQASQLLAQVAVALRTLGASLARTLESSGGSAASSSCGAQRLLSGLLLVGRLAWLLKIRGRFLDVALVAPGVAVASSSGGSASVGGTQPSDLSSEDQLRSALEIADTNGDGVVTYSEAVEAVQALAVGDTDESGTAGGVSVPQTPFLSMLLTPTLTFAEMAMLCAHLLSPETCRPELRLRSCLEELLTSTHRAWCTFVVGDLGTALAEELSVELGLRGHAHFRALWTLRSVEGDERERLLVPSSCSAAMSRFCMSLNQRSSASLVSIDTVQALPPPADAASSRLSVQVLAMLHTAALESVVAQYTAVLATRDADAAEGERIGAAAKGPGSAARKLARERLLEDCALQACFDLSVLEAVAGRCCVTAPRGLRVAQQGWAARLDPINAQLLGPLLQIAARTFSARSFLLFPGVRALGSGSSSASAAASAAAEEDAVAGIFASGVGVGSQRDRDAAPCRFSLLPLAISSGRGGGADAEAADGVVTASAKSRTKGNKASQESGGGLSKTLITSLGSILG